MKTRSRNRNEKNNICGIKYSESCAKQGNKYSCNDRDTQKCCSYPERISNRTFRKASVNRVPATINSTTKSTLKSQPNGQKPSANRVNLSTGLTRGNADIRCKTRTAHTKSIRTKKVGRKCPFEGKDKGKWLLYCRSGKTLESVSRRTWIFLRTYARYLNFGSCAFHSPPDALSCALLSK